MQKMQNVVVNVNGQILTPEQASVSVFDRSYLYGDSLYEVARTYKGKPLFLHEHLLRMKRSAELCHMALDQPLEIYQKEMQRTLEAFLSLPGQAAVEAYIRIVLSRGIGKIGFGLNCLLSPTQYTIIVQPLNPPSDEQFEKGFRFRVVDRLRNDSRALDPAMKSGNYLNNLLAYLEATNDGFDDALLCNSEGHITEGTTFNIFYARNGIIATPPLDIGILHGLTRHAVIETARQLGYWVREVRFSKERLYEADEVFMTSTIKEVFPVTQVDNSHTSPGPITKKLRDAFRSRVPEWLNA
jgi:branched-chain amino acid aminotransferase